MTPRPEWEPLLSAVMQHALRYRESLSERPAAPAAAAESVLAALGAGAPLSDAGRSAGDVLEELVARATPGITAMAGPRFFGWVTGGTLPSALAADWMTSAWDQNAGPATGAPAACAFELASVRWVVELLGLPPETRGAFVSGATLANLSALAAARTRVFEAAGWDVEQEGLRGAPEALVLVGRERHDSLDKALRLLGLGRRSVRVVDADGQGRLVPAALRRALAGANGPLIVCAQAGNVNSGAFDPLDEVSSALDDWRARRKRELGWLHVDGAFGLWARAAAATRTLAAGAELADSWATDGHKYLNLPYDSGLVLTRHPRALRRAMAVHGAYLSSGAAPAIENPGALVPELSRRARGFVWWAALRELGRSGVEALVARCVELARLFAQEVRRVEGLSVLNQVVFNQVVVKAEPAEGSSPQAFTLQLAVALQQDGTCYATPTVWRGAPGLRFSVCNASTGPEDVLASAQALARVYRALASAPAGPAHPRASGH